MTEVTVVDERTGEIVEPALFPGANASKTAMVIDEGLSFEDWSLLGQQLRMIEGSVLWWIGDWLNYGEARYGETYAQAIDATDYSYQALKDAKWVASQYQMSRRRDNLSFSHHREALGAPDPDAALDAAEAGNLSQKDLRKHIRDMKRAIPPPITDLYRVIYADPPWYYGNSGLPEYGHAETHYPTMKIDELCAMSVPAADDAVLFMWATSPLLEDAMSVIDAWGFEYKTSFVWDKVKHNFGYYNSVRHELLLVATRGSCVPDEKKLFDSVVVIERTAIHSQKPEEFRQMIDTLYTHGKRIELFARRAATGWDVWGNDVAA